MYNILIVDDMPDIRKLVAMILKGEGYLTLEAANGAEALSILEENGTIDLVLLDAMMGVMDGYQTVKEIVARNREHDLNVKVCFLTAKRAKEDVMKALKLGAHDYLVKPIDRPVLLEKVKGLVGAAGTNQEKFATITLNVQATEVESPYDINLRLKKLSETTVEFVSPIGMKVDCTASLFSKVLLKKIGLSDTVLRCRVTNCIPQGEVYNVTASIIGLSDSDAKHIRSLTLQGRHFDEE